MFDKYYRTTVNGDLVYYVLKTVDNGAEMKLYKNADLIGSKTGMMGTFEIAEGDLKLVVKNTALKSTHTLTNGPTEINLEKIKKADLKQLLTQRRFFNDINPTAEEIQANKFNTKRLIIPFALLLLGIILSYNYTGDDKNDIILYSIPSFVAGVMFYLPLREKLPFLKGIRGALIGFGILTAVLAGGLAEVMKNMF